MASVNDRAARHNAGRKLSPAEDARTEDRDRFQEAHARLRTERGRHAAAYTTGACSAAIIPRDEFGSRDEWAEFLRGLYPEPIAAVGPGWDAEWHGELTHVLLFPDQVRDRGRRPDELIDVKWFTEGGQIDPATGWWHAPVPRALCADDVAKRREPVARVRVAGAPRDFYNPDAAVWHDADKYRAFMKRRGFEPLPAGDRMQGKHGGAPPAQRRAAAFAAWGVQNGYVIGNGFPDVKALREAGLLD